MEKNISEQLLNLIARDFELSQDEPLTEEQLLEALTERTAYLLATQPDYLMSMLYRLDVKESLVEQAFHPAHEEPTHIVIAKLIFNRQKQRIESKLKYKQPPIDEEGYEY